MAGIEVVATTNSSSPFVTPLNACRFSLPSNNNINGNQSAATVEYSKNNSSLICCTCVSNNYTGKLLLAVGATDKKCYLRTLQRSSTTKFSESEAAAASSLWHATLSTHEAAVVRCAFNERDEQLATGCRNGSITVWDVEQEKILRCFTADTTKSNSIAGGRHQASITSIDFMPLIISNCMLATASDDRSVKLWDMRYNRACVRTFRAHTDSVLDVKISPHGRWIASAGREGNILLWSVESSDRLLHTFNHQQHYHYDHQPFMRASDTLSRSRNNNGGPFLCSIRFHPHELLLASLSASTSTRTISTTVYSAESAPATASIKFWDLDHFECLSTYTFDDYCNNSSDLSANTSSSGFSGSDDTTSDTDAAINTLLPPGKQSSVSNKRLSRRSQTLPAHNNNSNSKTPSVRGTTLPPGGGGIRAYAGGPSRYHHSSYVKRRRYSISSDAAAMPSQQHAPKRYAMEFAQSGGCLMALDVVNSTLSSILWEEQEHDDDNDTRINGSKKQQKRRNPAALLCEQKIIGNLSIGDRCRTFEIVAPSMHADNSENQTLLFTGVDYDYRTIESFELPVKNSMPSSSPSSSASSSFTLPLPPSISSSDQPNDNINIHREKTCGISFYCHNDSNSNNNDAANKTKSATLTATAASKGGIVKKKGRPVKRSDCVTRSQQQQQPRAETTNNYTSTLRRQSEVALPTTKKTVSFAGSSSNESSGNSTPKAVPAVAAKKQQPSTRGRAVSILDNSALQNNNSSGYNSETTITTTAATGYRVPARHTAARYYLRRNSSLQMINCMQQPKKEEEESSMPSPAAAAARSNGSKSGAALKLVADAPKVQAEEHAVPTISTALVTAGGSDAGQHYHPQVVTFTASPPNAAAASNNSRKNKKSTTPRVSSSLAACFAHLSSQHNSNVNTDGGEKPLNDDEQQPLPTLAASKPVAKAADYDISTAVAAAAATARLIMPPPSAVPPVRPIRRTQQQQRQQQQEKQRRVTVAVERNDIIKNNTSSKLTAIDNVKVEAACGSFDAAVTTTPIDVEFFINPKQLVVKQEENIDDGRDHIVDDDDDKDDDLAGKSSFSTKSKKLDKNKRSSLLSSFANKAIKSTTNNYNNNKMLFKSKTKNVIVSHTSSSAAAVVTAKADNKSKFYNDDAVEKTSAAVEKPLPPPYEFHKSTSMLTVAAPNPFLSASAMLMLTPAPPNAATLLINNNNNSDDSPTKNGDDNNNTTVDAARQIIRSSPTALYVLGERASNIFQMLHALQPQQQPQQQAGGGGARNQQLSSNVNTAKVNVAAAVALAVHQQDAVALVDLLAVLADGVEISDDTNAVQETVWNLRICTTLLPEIYMLLQHDVEAFVMTACRAVRDIVQRFGPTLYSTLQAPKPVGIDLTREARLEQCRQCVRQLNKVRAYLHTQCTTNQKKNAAGKSSVGGAKSRFLRKEYELTQSALNAFLATVGGAEGYI